MDQALDVRWRREAVVTVFNESNGDVVALELPGEFEG
jgi:hypothetical protein